MLGRLASASSSRLRSLLPPALPGLASPLVQQVRHRLSNNNYGQRKSKPGRPHAGRGNAVWWQPLLPALAAERCPEVEGKGNRRKKMQQRKQQSIWDHARRKEGHRRAKIFAQLKREKEDEKVRQVYRDYAEMLRAKALAEGSAATAAGEEARDAQE